MLTSAIPAQLPIKAPQPAANHGRGRPLPFHVFRMRGKNFMLHVPSSAVMCVDDPAYDALSKMAAGEPREAIVFHLQNQYGERASQSIDRELQVLTKAGIFEPASSQLDEDEVEPYIQRLTRMSTNSIELYLAEQCNLRCRYCYVSANDALTHGLMSEEVAARAVDLVFARAGSPEDITITFFGGEPLLNKKTLLSTIAHSQQLAKRHGKRVHYAMTTNGTLIDDEVVSLIKRYNFGLMISLDGPRDVQDHMRPLNGGGGSFEQATAGIKRLMQRRRMVTVRCTISSWSLDQPRIVQFLEEFGFTRIALSYSFARADQKGPFDIDFEENKIIREQDTYFMDRLLDRLDRGESIKYNPWSSMISDIHNRNVTHMRCGVGRGCTTVGIDGALYPCHRYVGMQRYRIGDVYQGLDRQKFAAYLQRYFETKKKCQECWAVNLCGGYCAWYLSNQDGTLTPPKDWWCEEQKKDYEQAIWLYERLKVSYPEYFNYLTED